MFLRYPLSGILTLTLLLAVVFLLEGILKIALSFKVKPQSNWGWLLVSGIAGIILAIIIILEFPAAAAWILGLLVGINLLISGLTLVMLATSVVALD